MQFVQQRNVIDFAAKMNLLAYAQGDYLDHLGALLGVRRLDASSASCTVRFSLSAPLSYSITIPIGTRVTPDGKIFFATSEEIKIPAGLTESEAVCVCTDTGIIGNDYVPGQICKVVDVFAFELDARNIDTSSGGADIESDESFRERIHIAPESFTTAGSVKGYEYYARSADANIIDVKVLTANDDSDIPAGNVYIFVLMTGGTLPNDDTLAKVLEACNSEYVRPDTDYVHVLKPVQIDYSVNVDYWIDVGDSASSEIIQASVSEAVSEWVKWQSSALGRDINPSRLSHDIIAAGAKRCEIISPGFASVSSNEIAHLLSPVKIGFKGLED